MGLTMSYSQKADCPVAFLDRNGKVAPVDGAPAWSTDNTDLLALEPSADGMACVVRALGPLGAANVTVSADADMGDGNEPVIGVLEVTIGPGKATVVTITPGAPVEQE